MGKPTRSRRRKKRREAGSSGTSKRERAARAKPQRKWYQRRTLWVLSLCLVALLGVAAGNWWWGFLQWPSHDYSFYKDGQLKADIAIHQQRACHIAPELWGGEPPGGTNWYWVLEHHGYYPNGQLAEHGFYRPFRVKTGNVSRDEPPRQGDQHWREGRWSRWYVNGKRMSEANYRAGEKHGDWVLWPETGAQEVHIRYVDDRRNGPMDMLMDGKLVRRDTFRDDVEHGPRLRFYFPDGGKAQQWEFEAGQMNGPHYQWDIEGNLLVEGRFKDDKRHGVWTRHFPQGKRHSLQHYRDGELDGSSTTWYPDGKLKSQGEYRDGKQHGPWTEWTPEGKKRSEGQFVDGKRDGEWTFWDTQGKATTIVYDQGRVVRKAAE